MGSYRYVPWKYVQPYFLSFSNCSSELTLVASTGMSSSLRRLIMECVNTSGAVPSLRSAVKCPSSLTSEMGSSGILLSEEYPRPKLSSDIVMPDDANASSVFWISDRLIVAPSEGMSMMMLCRLHPASSASERRST